MLAGITSYKNLQNHIIYYSNNKNVNYNKFMLFAFYVVTLSIKAHMIYNKLQTFTNWV